MLRSMHSLFSSESVRLQCGNHGNCRICWLVVPLTVNKRLCIIWIHQSLVAAKADYHTEICDNAWEGRISRDKSSNKMTAWRRKFITIHFYRVCWFYYRQAFVMFDVHDVHQWTHIMTKQDIYIYISYTYMYLLYMMTIIMTPAEFF